MEPELKKLLEKNLEVSQKTLSLIKKIRRDAWFSRVFNVVKWLVILGAAAWLYTEIEPIFQQIFSAWDNTKDVVESIKNLPQIGN
jgi:hypothetical protein